jgi:hypothetical protein
MCLSRSWCATLSALCGAVLTALTNIRALIWKVEGWPEPEVAKGPEVLHSDTVALMPVLAAATLQLAHATLAVVRITSSAALPSPCEGEVVSHMVSEHCYSEKATDSLPPC